MPGSLVDQHLLGQPGPAAWVLAALVLEDAQQFPEAECTSHSIGQVQIQERVDVMVNEVAEDDAPVNDSKFGEQAPELVALELVVYLIFGDLRMMPFDTSCQAPG